MAASLIENKNSRSQRSVSHAGFPASPMAPYKFVTDDDGHAMTNADNSDGNQRLLGAPPASTIRSTSVNMANNDNSNSFNNDENLSFYPLKSYKTGKITDSTLSVMRTEIGPVFTSESSTKKTNNFINNFINGSRSGLFDNKPIRASKSTLDLPNLTQQNEDDFLKVERESRRKKDKGKQSPEQQDSSPQQRNCVEEPSKIRKRSASPSPSTSPKIVPTMVTVDTDGNCIATTAEATSDDAFNFTGEKKEKKRRSFKLKLNKDKEKESKGSGATQPSPSLSPASVKVSQVKIM